MPGWRTSILRKPDLPKTPLAKLAFPERAVDNGANVALVQEVRAGLWMARNGKQSPVKPRDSTMSNELPTIYLARHGETAWTLSHQHTGRSDIPLTARGESNARSLGDRLRGVEFQRVLTSPLARARRTCELAGFLEPSGIEPDLTEWDYGEYDGQKTVEIRRKNPGWSLFRDGCPGGESVAQVAARADRLIARLRAIEGRQLLFGHGHFFRVLAARWLDLTAGDGRLLYLSTASLSILGFEHSLEEPAIRLWNDDRHVRI
jgi:broad specificity phosphatase PhoE